MTVPQREVEPEWLDELPVDDPRAVHSRRDLRVINGWMGHVGIMARALGDAFGDRPPRTIVELGAGDGSFLLKLAHRLPSAWKPARVVLVDRQPLVRAATRETFAARGWNAEPIQMDVFDWLDARGSDQPSDLTLTNLFLHHFKDAALQRLLRLAAAQTTFFLACEPRRFDFDRRMAALLWLIGCNDVTQHDARISVRASFRERELSALWPTDRAWRLTERPAGLFSHCFSARRPVISASNADSRRPNPESRASNPDSRVPTPESRDPNPESQPPNPESRIPNPVP